MAGSGLGFDLGKAAVTRLELSQPRLWSGRKAIIIRTAPTTSVLSYGWAKVIGASKEEKEDRLTNLLDPLMRTSSLPMPEGYNPVSAPRMLEN